jgi:4-alpha-glucanotransferase
MMTSGTQKLVGKLYELARLYRVQASYRDVGGRQRKSSTESLMAVLRALGAPITKLEDIPHAFRERERQLWASVLEPVWVVFEGRKAELPIRLPAKYENASIACHLTFEGGETQTWNLKASTLLHRKAVQANGTRYLVGSLTLPAQLPCGYHHLQIELEGKTARSMVVAAPREAYEHPVMRAGKAWGVFVPLYALRSNSSWGAGNFSDLASLLEWVHQWGGSTVSTLPLLASFLDEPFDPSPYAPASRLAWNEFYLDVRQIPEFRNCSSAHSLFESTQFQNEMNSLRRLQEVDYRREMAAKRKILQKLAACFYRTASARHPDFERFLRSYPVICDYARFRAVCEQLRTPWTEWPGRLRDGHLRAQDYDLEHERYHQYVQWQTHEQLKGTSDCARRGGLGLCLDLPLGIHPAGYDVWRERSAFVPEMSGGAPPDAVFTKGQNWNFPPLHPEAIREQGYRYFIACLRHQLEHAGLLRIDHIMGLHRLYWIPKGSEARDGVFVRYRAEEFYAILLVESHRYESSIAGENLGTVPAYVDAAMARRNVKQLYVLQYELASPAKGLPKLPTRDDIASLNTHDMPPFAAYLRGLDIEDRVRRGLLSSDAVQAERKARRTSMAWLERTLRQAGWLAKRRPRAEDYLLASLKLLGASPASLVLVNLEDLWLEVKPQNIPASPPEDNWRSRLRYTQEEFIHLPQIRNALEQVHRERQGDKRKHG